MAREIGATLTIQGKISTVRFVETSYNARKVKLGKYWAYEVACATSDEALSYARAIEGEYPDRTIWTTIEAIYDPADVAAEERAEAAAEAAQRALEDVQPIHANWQRVADHLRAQGVTEITNRVCRDFIVDNLHRVLGERSTSVADGELVRTIIWTIEDDVTAKAADYYESMRPQLKPIVDRANAELQRRTRRRR